MLPLQLAWAIFWSVFVLNHVRNRKSSPPKENRIRRDRSSDLGMALQGLGIFIAFLRPGSPRDHLLPYSLALAAAAILYTNSALRHLGRQWRVTAVVTDDHELITTGPYSVIRHPIYLGVLAMLSATLLLRTHPYAIAPALLTYLAGTEIRIRAEENLLSHAFPAAFPPYRARTSAYLPFLR